MGFLRLLKSIIRGKRILDEIKHEKDKALSLIEEERTKLFYDLQVRREEIMFERQRAITDINMQYTESARKLTQERNLLSEERVRFLNEMAAGLQVETEMMREINGDRYHERAERIKKSIVNIHAEKIDNLTGMTNDYASTSASAGQCDDLSE